VTDGNRIVQGLFSTDAVRRLTASYPSNLTLPFPGGTFGQRPVSNPPLQKALLLRSLDEYLLRISDHDFQ